MNKKIKIALTLLLCSVFLFNNFIYAKPGGGGSGDDQGVLIRNDNQQRFEFISRIPDTDRFFRMVTLGWFIEITKPNGSSAKAFIEGGTDGDNDEPYIWTFDSIVQEFYDDGGGTARNIANDFFFNTGGTINMSAIVTLGARTTPSQTEINEGYFRKKSDGTYLTVWGKLNDNYPVGSTTPNYTAYNVSVKQNKYRPEFWDWSDKSSTWSYYAVRINKYGDKNTISPYPFSASNVKNSQQPEGRCARTYQQAVLLCEWSESTLDAQRDFYNLTQEMPAQPKEQTVSISAPAEVDAGARFKISVNYINNSKVSINELVSASWDGAELPGARQWINIPAKSSIIREYWVTEQREGIFHGSASINIGRTILESDYSDDVASVSVRVGPSTDLSVAINEPNSNYRTGTDVITSAFVYNSGNADITPEKNIKVSFSVMDGRGLQIYSAMKNLTVPKNESQLVYFEWRTPAESCPVKITFNVDSSGALPEPNKNNNVAFMEKNIFPVKNNAPPDQTFKDSTPTGWRKPDIPTVDNKNDASWYEWTYDNKTGFQKKLFYVKINDLLSSEAMVPDSNDPTRYREENGRWHMKSGYGFTSNPFFNVDSSVPSSDAVTGMQRAVAFLPEYNYQGYFINYEKVSGSLNEASFQFPVNEFSKYGSRIHFVPLWFPDGDYVMQVMGYDLWTPAGMLYEYQYPAVRVEGNVFEDYYIK